jgi:hypothetical protein
VNRFRSTLNGSGKPAKQPLLATKPVEGRTAPADCLDKIAVPRSETRLSNHRGEDRHRLNQEDAVARWNGVEQAVDLINLSCGGAMIGAAFRPKLWDRVDLVLGGCGTLECAVRWIKGDRVGLEFAHETQIEASPEVRAETLRAVIARSFPDIALARLTEPLDAPEPSSPSLSTDMADPQASEASRRDSARHPLIWSGVVHHNHDSNPVRLRNISAGGALIESSGALPLGAELLLDLGEAGSLFATVTWARGDQAGLEFRTPFDLTQLSRSKPEVAPTRWAQPTYLREESGDSSPWASQWGRLNLSELESQLQGFLKR